MARAPLSLGDVGTVRGAALSVAMTAVEMIQGKALSLLWCSDWEQDFGPPDDATDGHGGRLQAYLLKVRNAVHGQGSVDGECLFGVGSRQSVGDSRAKVFLRYVTGIRIDVIRFGAHDPEKGVWRVFPEEVNQHARPDFHDLAEAGGFKDPFWFTGIPFVMLLSLIGRF